MIENMKIGAKLYMLIGILSILLVAVGALGLRGMKTTNDSLETVYRDRLVPVVLLSEIDSLRRDSVQELLLAHFHDPKLPASRTHEADHPVTRHAAAVMANRARIDKLWERYLAAALTPEEKRLAESLIAHTERFRAEGQDQVLARLKDRKFDDAGLLSVNKLIPLSKQRERDFGALMQHHVDAAKAEHEMADDRDARAMTLAVICIVGGMLLTWGIGLWIIRSITDRLTQSTSDISASAAQIAATITQHERTAGSQAAAAGETSATITELSASARQSSEQAANAAAAAEKAGAATAQGGEAARQAAAAMAGLKDKIAAMADRTLRLGEQTGQIGAIAALVKDLSGQINMLALNAAVEAARAGEQGKGFAVVAGEVRKLADQSKKSAEQAAGLVADMQKAANSSIMMTEEGARTTAEVTQLAQKVAELFGSLSGMALGVNENAQQVMLNARQQSAAFTQVAEATNAVAAGAKETAAGISQTKAGVRKLNEAAANLEALSR